MWAIPTGTGLVIKKKKSGKESQYMVSRPELGSDLPFGSGRESGRDRLSFGELTPTTITLQMADRSMA